ncbi:glucose-1-phosphate thymidylyltransferase RfbA [Pelagibius sp. Alg239-R121]|uniref:glucose-1-phosphate thymidylyltransferase RfbA n=1 Tax=Pelagibius sp. Alg239-R121 TaxID=2993448 RepID=UPI0024A69EC7|nr:glucose-1-phosphate thymidylyltransferase RfbA [Pelagibius sp. Alg239-R121]
MTEIDKTNRKGIVLAGGSGTRLHPLTVSVSKQLLPVYDKPMIYYPISNLMLAGINEVLIITAPDQEHLFRNLLGDGTQLGMQFDYAVQEKPEGVPEAFVIGADFIGDDPVTLILGDNIFYGQGLVQQLRHAVRSDRGATIFAYIVSDPQRYGVVTFDDTGKPVEIAEKPKRPRSDYAVTGLYFFDNDVVEIAQSLKPSKRGETEIIDVVRAYMTRGDLSVERMGRGIAWLDVGTHQALAEAAAYVQAVDHRQGFKIACIEEIAWRQQWIDDAQLKSLSAHYGNSPYGEYLAGLLESRL